MTTPKSIDELIGLPDEDAIVAFLREHFHVVDLHIEVRRAVARDLAKWLKQNDTRRALIEAMLPVFVTAMQFCDISRDPSSDESSQDDLIAATRDAFNELDAETLKALGVL